MSEYVEQPSLVTSNQNEADFLSPSGLKTNSSVHGRQCSKFDSANPESSSASGTHIMTEPDRIQTHGEISSLPSIATPNYERLVYAVVPQLKTSEGCDKEESPAQTKHSQLLAYREGHHENITFAGKFRQQERQLDSSTRGSLSPDHHVVPQIVLSLSNSEQLYVAHAASIPASIIGSQKEHLLGASNATPIKRPATSFVNRPGNCLTSRTSQNTSVNSGDTSATEVCEDAVTYDKSLLKRPRIVSYLPRHTEISGHQSASLEEADPSHYPKVFTPRRNVYGTTTKSVTEPDEVLWTSYNSKDDDYIHPLGEFSGAFKVVQQCPSQANNACRSDYNLSLRSQSSTPTKEITSNKFEGSHIQNQEPSFTDQKKSWRGLQKARLGRPQVVPSETHLDNASVTSIGSTSAENLKASLALPERATNLGVVDAPGIIKSIKLQNVMSYGNFEIKWSPNFNLVMGENGSGKSALVVAVMAVLGARAFDIGRGSTLKTIIKDGKSAARIEIALQGHSVFSRGNEIKISRTFCTDGSSRYRVSENGTNWRIIERSQLDSILSGLNIQINNPLMILNQDMARNFLKTKEPGELYNYFRRGFLVDACESLLNEATHNVEKASRCLQSKNALLEELKRKARSLEQDINIIERLNESKKRLHRLEQELAWAITQELEENRDRSEAELQRATDKVEIISKEIKSIENSVKELEASQRIPAQSREMQNTLRTKTAELVRKQNERHEIRTTVTRLQRKCSLIYENIRKLELQLSATEQILQMYSSEDRSNIDAGVDSEVQKLESKKEELKKELSDKIVILEHLRYAQERAREKAEAEELLIRDLGPKIDRLRGELKLLEKVSESKYEVFGAKFARVVGLIKADSGFQQKPRGPLGACFTVKEEKWAPVVEHIFGSSLLSFAVDNNEDRMRLQTLFDQVFGSDANPTIAYVRFGKQKLDITRGKATSGHPTVLDVIEIENDDHAVFNWLVDMFSVERILLFENYAQGCNVMSEQSRFPQKTLRGYSRDEYLFFPDPNFKALAQINFRQKRVRVTAGKVPLPRKERLQEELDKVIEECKRKNVMHLRMKYNLVTAKQEYEQCLDAINGVTSSLGKIDFQLRSLRNSSKPNIDLASMEDENTQIKQEIEDRKKEVERLQGQLILLRNDESELNKCIEKLDAERAELKQELEELKSRQENEMKRIQPLIETLQKLRYSQRLAINLREEAQKKLDDANNELQNQMATTKKQCPTRIKELSGTSTEIEACLHGLKIAIQRTQEKARKEAEIRQKYNNAQISARTVEFEIGIMGPLIDVIEASIKIQMDSFEKRIRNYGTFITLFFNELVANAGYHGKLLINHEQKSLVCFVTLDHANARKAEKLINFSTNSADRRGVMEFLSSLSGGERSLGTVYFLMSCWHAMDLPFFMVDESEVFMDEAHQESCMKLIIDVAKAKNVTQFFMMTPRGIPYPLPEGSQSITLKKNGSGTLGEASSSKSATGHNSG